MASVRRKKIPPNAIYSKDDIQYNPDQDFLGSGSYSEVYKCQLKAKGPSEEPQQTVALKVLSDKRRKDKKTRSLHKEAEILFSLPPHEHIVRCFGVCEAPDFFGLLFEYVKGGDLSDLVGGDDDDDDDDGGGGGKGDDAVAHVADASANKQKPFGELAAPAFDKWENRLGICRQISSGMAFLHSKNVVHFDIKPDNILLELTSSGQLKCKITDFGLAKVRFDSDWTATNQISKEKRGTRAFMAPERSHGVALQTEDRMKSDVYSFGVTMWSMREKKSSFDIDAGFDCLRRSTSHPLAPVGYSETMQRCTEPWPTVRPPFEILITCFDDMIKHFVTHRAFEKPVVPDTQKPLSVGMGRGRGGGFHSSDVAMRLSARPGSYGSRNFGAIPLRQFTYSSAAGVDLAYETQGHGSRHPSSFAASADSAAARKKMQLSLKEQETPGKNCVLMFGLPPNPDQAKVIKIIEKAINGKILKYWGEDMSKDEKSCVRIELQNHDDISRIWKFRKSLQYDDNTPVTIDVDCTEEYERDKFLISNIAQKVTKEDLLLHIKSQHVMKNEVLADVRFLSSDETKGVVTLTEALVDESMVKRLNQAAKEFEIDEGVKLCLDFSLIPAALELEVSAPSPEVNKAGWTRYFFALPCSPLVEKIVKSPEKDAFLVKLRTESDVKSVMDMRELPPIRGDIRPRIRRHSEILSQISTDEEDLYSEASAVSPSTDVKEQPPMTYFTPAVFSVTEPKIGSEVMNFIMKRDACVRALEQLGDALWYKSEGVFVIRSRESLSAEEEDKWKKEVERKFFLVYDGFGRRELNMTSSEFFEKMANFAKNENVSKGSEILIREYQEKFLLVFIGDKAQVDRVYQPCSEKHSSLAREEEIVIKYVKCPSSRYLDLLRLNIYFKQLVKRQQFAVRLESCRIFLRGPALKVIKAKDSLEAALLEMKEKKVSVSSDLAEYFVCGGLKKFLSLLSESGVQAVVLDTQPHFHILAMNDDQLRKAVNIYETSFTTEDVVSPDDESLSLMRSEEMGQWIREQCNKSEDGILSKGFGDRDATKFLLTGFTASVVSVSKDCYKYLAKNVLYESCRQLRTASIAKFIKRFFLESFASAADELQEFRAEVFIRAGSQVVMKATKNGLGELEKRVDRQLAKIKLDHKKFKKHGLRRYFAEGSYKQDKKNIEEKESVLILLDEADEDTVSFAAAQPRSVFLSAFIPSNAPLKRICLYSGDICEHQVDAIVNAANESLCHAGGLAAHIVQYAGDEVQDECFSILKDLPNGRVATGDAVKTGPGQLQTTKSIIHAVGPEWDGMHQCEDSKRLLADAVYASLKIASKMNFSSVALPAISAGIFGGLSAVVADVMVKAVDEFFSEHPLTSILSVDFVMLLSDEDNVRCFSDSLERLLRRTSAVAHSPNAFAASASESSAEVLTEESAATAKVAESVAAASMVGNAAASVHAESCSFVVKVKIGDIAKQKANAIVIPTSEDLDLALGETSKAIASVAGPQLQKDCILSVKANGSLKPGDVRTTSGYGLPAGRVFYVCSSQTVEDIGLHVYSCLEEAAKFDVTKIAFPAIGTGGLNFDADKAAKSLFDGIKRFRRKRPHSSLRKVSVVIYKKTNLSAYQHAFENIFGSVELISTSSKPGEQLTTSNDALLSNGSTLSVNWGDVTTETTEAIIATEGVVWDELQKAYPSLKTDWEKGKKKIPMELKVDSRVVYLISPKKFDSSSTDATNIKKIAPLVADCLTKAATAGHSSISLPAIGTARLLFSNTLSAQAIIQGAREFAEKVPTSSLKNIKLSVFDSDRLSDFEAELRNQFSFMSKGHPFDSDLPSCLASTVHPKTLVGIAEAEPEAVSATVVGTSKDACSTAIKSLQEAIDRVCIVRKIKMDLPNDIEGEELKTIAEGFGVALVVKIEKEKPSIFLKGTSSDVLNAYSEVCSRIGDLLKREKSETEDSVLAANLCWKWDDAKGRSEFFNPKTNRELEAAFRANENPINLVLQGEKVHVDFEKLILVNVQTKEKKKISRRTFDFSGHACIPLSWTIYRIEENYKLVPLPPTNQDYGKVSHSFTSTFASNLSPQIKKIERIENPRIFLKYEEEKKTLQKLRRNELAAKRAILEQELFHGTSAVGDRYKQIIANGFNRSYAGSVTGKRYGGGVYFAKCSGLSNDFAKPDTNGDRVIFFCKVLLGLYTVGNSTMVEPPLVDPKTSKTNTFDSTVDNVENPTIFVSCYRDNLAYPTFLITYRLN